MNFDISNKKSHIGPFSVTDGMNYPVYTASRLDNHIEELRTYVQKKAAENYGRLMPYLANYEVSMDVHKSDGGLCIAGIDLKIFGSLDLVKLVDARPQFFGLNGLLSFVDVAITDDGDGPVIDIHMDQSKLVGKLNDEFWDNLIATIKKDYMTLANYLGGRTAAFLDVASTPWSSIVWPEV
jgi:hypothetical protein